jgi:polyhydroxyalkanoate synthesis repressor PhaR
MYKRKNITKKLQGRNIMRVIKKYPNRRLYDMQTSTYMTIDEARQLLLDGTAIQIVDANTRYDITSNALRQMLCDTEDKQSQPLLGLPLLTGCVMSGVQNSQPALSGLLHAAWQAYADAKLDQNHVLEAREWAQFAQYQQAALQQVLQQHLQNSVAQFLALKADSARVGKDLVAEALQASTLTSKTVATAHTQVELPQPKKRGRKPRAANPKEIIAAALRALQQAENDKIQREKTQLVSEYTV